MDDEAGRKKYGWMWDSSTFQAILEEGREEGRAQGRAEAVLDWVRQLLLDLGTVRFGPPDAETIDMLNAIDDLDTLRRIVTGVLKPSSWKEMLATASES